MTRLFPRMTNGGLEILFSESVCINPSKEFRIEIPVSTSGGQNIEAVLRFTFEFSGRTPSIETFDEPNNTIRIKLSNIRSAGGLTSPMTFSIGDQQLSLLLAGHAIGASTGKVQAFVLTLTVFKGNIT